MRSEQFIDGKVNVIEHEEYWHLHPLYPFQNSWRNYKLEMNNYESQKHCVFCLEGTLQPCKEVYGHSPQIEEETGAKVTMFHGPMCERCQRRTGLSW